MRVLSVGNMYPPHHFGGYELVWRSAVEHLRERGHEVRALTTDTHTGTTEPDGPDVHRELRWHLRDGEFEHLSPRATLAMTRHNHVVLARHLGEMRPDVVAWWSMGGLTLTMLEAVRRRGIPAVAFVHDEWLDYGRMVDPWLRKFHGPRRGRLAPVAERLSRLPARVDFAAAAKYVFVSDFTRRQALDAGVPLARTDVAHSGIHPGFIRPAPEQQWRWRLLYVGRIDRRKGIDTAIEALPHLPAEAHLTVVGGWDEREQGRLEELSGRLGVRGRLTFAGQQDRDGLATAYEDADAVVFPVRWDEPWGLVPIESMARGRPVAATGRGGSGEYLRDGENCVLFEADDAIGLAGAVKRLASDPALRERLREHGLHTAERHTEPVFNAAVEQALLEAAGSPSRTAPDSAVAA
jgi:glycogen(starch) synthase